MTAALVALLLALTGIGVLAALLLAKTRRARALEASLSRAQEELQYLEQAFSRFAPRDVVERISGGARELAPERRDVTVMFADLVGFTRLSEEWDPGVMVRILNGYFRSMHIAIRAHHGRVSRMMGDGLMALFGAMDDNPWHTQDAVRAALAMRDALGEYNKSLLAESLPQLRFGIGIHRGEVIAGVLGGDELMEYTVIGDPVNTAARVEALTRHHGVDILVTDHVRRDLDERFRLRQMPPMPLKGKLEAIGTWSVEALEAPPPRAVAKSPA